ncbi:MAG: 4-hydroxythreonine-4-phosphate dehydrogenase PdxA [Cyclobacteriaceae bacterium]|jgi:4-hydroxythreonine-4-phosphate dehydrogenase
MKQKNQRNTTKPIIGISIGDMNGIGPEVTIGALSDTRMLKSFVPVIYASGGLISYYRKQMKTEQFSYHQCENINDIHLKKINVINCWTERVEIQPGSGNEESGKYARVSLAAATEDLKAGKLDGMVTAPLSKEFVKNDEFDFPGHTEYLTKVFEASDSLMLMILGELRVGVVTGHIPLKEVSHKLTKELVQSKTEILLQSLMNDFVIKKPKIALLGLNPHAGENGILGSEDDGIIVPVIEEFKKKGNLVMGPFPADGFFGSGQFRNFDGVLAMYHDQGLIPFKTLTGGEGVNFTAGINKIRTSPAHGTAYNLAGKNVADVTSMRNALFAAIYLARNKMQEEAL